MKKRLVNFITGVTITVIMAVIFSPLIGFFSCMSLALLLEMSNSRKRKDNESPIIIVAGSAMTLIAMLLLTLIFG